MSETSLRSIFRARLPLVETLNALYFDHDYTEMVDGKPVRRSSRPRRLPTDYSARVYDQADCGRASCQHRRGAGPPRRCLCIAGR